MIWVRSSLRSSIVSDHSKQCLCCDFGLHFWKFSVSQCWYLGRSGGEESSAISLSRGWTGKMCGLWTPFLSFQEFSHSLPVYRTSGVKHMPQVVSGLAHMRPCCPLTRLGFQEGLRYVSLFLFSTTSLLLNCLQLGYQNDADTMIWGDSHSLFTKHKDTSQALIEQKLNKYHFCIYYSRSSLINHCTPYGSLNL